MHRQISICIVISNKTTASSIAAIILNLGFASIISANPEAAKDSIESTEIDFILLDLDFADNKSFELLDYVNAHDDYASIKIIGASFHTDRTFIARLKNYNFIGFLPKPFTRKVIENKITALIDTFKEHSSRRKHVRVVPEVNELMRVSFQLKNRKSISAKVLDVSLGGIGISLYADYDDEELTPGNLIEHIRFHASNYEIDVDAKLINKKEKFIAFKFTHFYNNTNQDLARYILRKLSGPKNMGKRI